MSSGLGNRFGGFSLRQVLKNLDDAVIRSSAGDPLSTTQSPCNWEVIEEYPFSDFSDTMPAERLLLFMSQTGLAQHTGRSKKTAKSKSRPVRYFNLDGTKLSVNKMLRDPGAWPRGTGIVIRSSAPGETAQVIYRFLADQEADKFVILEEMIP